jgi:hypothetical protein
MITFTFTLLVDHELGDDELESLFERADDVTPELGRGRTLLGFDRAAESLAAALVSALVDVEAVGLTARGLQSDDMVTLKEIAARTGRSYESARLLAAGRRGPGGFPAPLSADGWAIYSWSEVRSWFQQHLPSSLATGDSPVELEFDRLIAAADHLVRARALMRGDARAAGLAALVAA